MQTLEKATTTAKKKSGGVFFLGTSPGWCGQLCCLSHVPLGVTGMPGEKAMTAILSHPQVDCQTEDHQTKHREENLLHHRAGNNGLLIPVDDRYLDDLPADHDEAHRRREAHRPFTLDELRGCSQQHPASYNNGQYQARDGVVVKGRVSQPGDWQPLGKRADQKSYALTDGTQTDTGLDDDECDTYSFVFHD